MLLEKCCPYISKWFYYDYFDKTTVNVCHGFIATVVKPWLVFLRLTPPLNSSQIYENQLGVDLQCSGS